MIEKRPITLMGRTTDATVAMLLRVRAQVNGNHNRVHASLKSSRGPRAMFLLVKRMRLVKNWPTEFPTSECYAFLHDMRNRQF